MAHATTREDPFVRDDPAQPWNWHPELPLEPTPVLIWPPRPGAFATWLFGFVLLRSQQLLHVALALLAWYALTPSPERMAVVEPGWIFEIWLRNVALFTLVTGGLHLYFHTFRGQGDFHRLDRRALARNDRRFFLGNQVLDNMFWSLASGVTVWTAWEILIWWCWANGAAGWPVAVADGPVWFVAMFFVIWLFQDVHFYAVHRLIHWKPLYRFHRLHHRNVTIGPWSGISMHPVEHLLYFSSLLLHLVVVSHPIHVLFHGFYLAVGASVGHSGYHDIVVRGRSVFRIANMFHQLHHRYYHCNYGQTLVPLDRWLGTYHDGTAEATRRIMKRQRAPRAAPTSV